MSTLDDVSICGECQTEWRGGGQCPNCARDREWGSGADEATTQPRTVLKVCLPLTGEMIVGAAAMEIVRLRAEVERLRAALIRIGWKGALRREMLEIAWEALDGR